MNEFWRNLLATVLLCFFAFASHAQTPTADYYYKNSYGRGAGNVPQYDSYGRGAGSTPGYDSYGRGVGTVPNSDCGSNKEKAGALCYDKCKNGFHPGGAGVDINMCYENHNNVNPKKYKRGDGNPPSSSCGSNQELSGGLCYNSCRGGYHGNGVTCYANAKTLCGSNQELNAGLCYPTCRTGFHPNGPVCYANDKNLCQSGHELQGGLCYQTCRTGYAGNGPVCWGSPPKGYENCGAGFAKSGPEGNCGWVTAQQTVASAAFAATLSDVVLGPEAGATAALARVAARLNHYASDAKKMAVINRVKSELPDSLEFLMQIYVQYGPEIALIASKLVDDPRAVDAAKVASLLDKMFTPALVKRMPSAMEYVTMSATPATVEMVQQGLGQYSAQKWPEEVTFEVIRNVADFIGFGLDMGLPESPAANVGSSTLGVLSSYLYTAL